MSSHRGRPDPVSVALTAAVVLFVVLFAGGIVWLGFGEWSKTDSSHGACVFNGGFLDSKDFRAHAEPGSGRQYQGWMSQVIEYPTNVRQYDKSDGLPDTSVSVGGFTQTYSPVLSFRIATWEVGDDGKRQSCNLIEQHLRPLGATDFDDEVANSDWVNKFLNIRMAPAVRDSLPRVLSNGDPSALFLNTNGARDRAAERVAEEIGKALNAQLGDNYFCGTDYGYGQDEEYCTPITVVLPEPTMSEGDLAIIRAPQEARTVANNDISVATEQARAAQGVAAQKTEEAKAAEERANAEEKIASENARTADATATVEYAWCEYLVSLGQNCAFVKAAENENFPNVILGDADTSIAIPVDEGDGS